LANYEATVTAVRHLNAPWGLRLGQRRITVSTVGLPKQIERLATEGLQITLALSLHAPTDELRRELIPWARGVPLDRLLAACRTYRRTTGREMTLEYCLLAGVNDQSRHAAQLATIARDLGAHVNLLIYNPVRDLPFERPSRNRAVGFLHELRSLGARAHLRESRGLEADAACGQLRRRQTAG
jgi:23S rRNA (adenine2503-C2)-methyltransferase